MGGGPDGGRTWWGRARSRRTRHRPATRPMAARVARVARRLLRGRTPLPEPVYLALFAVLFGAGLGLRMYWTYALGAPFVVPDSRSYLMPALRSPALPLSEIRTIGLPYLLSLSLEVFRHPVGILIVNNLLWVVSTLALTLALRYRLGIRVGSLALLAYLVFCPIDAAEEYSLLSEHAARAFTLLLFTVMVLALRAPARRRYAVAMGLLALVNVLIKPAAAPLLVAVLTFYGLAALLLPVRRRTLAANAGLATALAVTGLLGYGQLFKDHYGTFGLTHFTGINLYSHVGHLTDLSSPSYPEIKAELREILPRYVALYVTRGLYYPSWLGYGTANAALKRDFGRLNPRSIIERHAADYPGATPMDRLDRVFVDLAVEGIRAHPLAYLDYAARRTLEVLAAAPVLIRDQALMPQWLPEHYQSVLKLNAILDPDGPDMHTALGRQVWDGMGGAPLRPHYTEPDEERRYIGIWPLYAHSAVALQKLFLALALPVQAVGLVLLVPATWRRVRRDRLIIAAQGYLILLGTAVFYGLINSADPIRYVTPVRDLWVVAVLLTLALALSAARRLALPWARRVGAAARWGLVAAGGLALLAVPSVWVRLGGYAALAFALGNLVLASDTARRHVLLWGLLLAYVFSPYWLAPSFLALPGGAALGWTALLLLCLVLARYHAARAARDGAAYAVGPAPVTGWREIGGWVLLLAAFAALQAHAVFADTPWRGDEPYHIVRSDKVTATLRAAATLPFGGAGGAWPAVAFAAAAVLRLALGTGGLSGPLARLGPVPRRLATALVRYGWIVAAAAWWAAAAGPFLPEWVGLIERYPAASQWVTAPLGLPARPEPLAEPWWVRLASLTGFAAAAGLVFSWVWRRCRDWPLALGAGLLFLSLPVVLFYGTRVALEAYLLPLEVAVLLAPGFLFAAAPRAVRSAAGNTALCLLVLLKETAIPLLALVAAIRAGVVGAQALRERRLPWRAAAANLGYLALLGLVVLPYLLARLASGDRGYVFTPSHWLRPGEYGAFALSLWTQTGLLLPLAAAGFVWLLAARRWRRAVAGAGAVATFALFFLADDRILLGYARFDLLVVPGLICLSLPLLVRLRRWSRALALGLVVAVIAVNLGLSPLHWRAGVSEPLWDRVRPPEDTEYFFPYRETVAWLRDHHAGRRVVLYQYDYPLMGFEAWYRNTPGLPPLHYMGRGRRTVAWFRAHQPVVLAAALRAAAAGGMDLLVFPCLDGPAPPALPPALRAGFRVAAVLANPYYAMAVFERVPEAAPGHPPLRPGPGGVDTPGGPTGPPAAPP